MISLNAPRTIDVAPYGAAKGIMGLTRAMALELAAGPYMVEKYRRRKLTI